MVLQVKQIGVDIDNTLTIDSHILNWENTSETTRKLTFLSAEPNTKLINVINEYYNTEMYEITLFTSRNLRYRKITEAWLKHYKINYHHLIMNKPCFDVLIDDRTMRPEEASKESIERFLK